MFLTACKFATIELSRKRILLLLKNQEGKEALGEISPFPSLNRETFEEALLQLRQFVPTLLGTNWTKEKLHIPTLYPSVSFGIESALLQLLDPLPLFSLPFSALFQGSARTIHIQAEKAARLGIKSAKLKIGDLKFAEAQSLIDALKGPFHLRIDLNQKWKDRDVHRLFSRYSAEDFDYIEDPFQNPKELIHFPLPYALDYRENISLQFPMKVLVLKPALAGQISKIRQKIILSSCFDTGIGIFHIASLAKRLGLSEPQGLGPYLHLNEDVLDQNLPIKEGLIEIPETISLQKKFYASLSDF